MITLSLLIYVHILHIIKHNDKCIILKLYVATLLLLNYSFSILPFT